MVVPYVIFWRERNQRVFDGVETPLERLKDNFITTIIFGITRRFAHPLLMRLSVWRVCVLDV